MPVINPSTTYPDGLTLDVDDHNKNVYDTAVGSGIASEVNGGLETVNLDPSFQVLEEHVMPGLSVRVNRDFSLRSVDCFEDLFAADVDHSAYSYDTAPGSLWVPVPGCSLAYYLPRQASVLMEVAFFFNVHRVEMVYTGDTPSRIAPALAVALAVDGVIQPETRRPLPCTAKYSMPVGTALLPAGLPAYATPRQYTEYANAKHWRLHVSALSQAAGEHDLQLMVYMESARYSIPDLPTRDDEVTPTTDGTRGQVVLQRPRVRPVDLASTASPSGSNKFTVSTRAHLVFNRASFGIRSSRVLAST